MKKEIEKLDKLIEKTKDIKKEHIEKLKKELSTEQKAQLLKLLVEAKSITEIILKREVIIDETR